jgi:cell wall-associated NlpC family hydrolase
MGPYEGYRRVTLLDQGDRVTVTRKAGDWYQVDLDDGRSGWIRSDFLEVSSRQSVASSRRSERSSAASSERSSSERRITASSKSKRSRESEREARSSTRKRTRTASSSTRRNRSASYSRPRYVRSASYTRRRARSEAQAPEASTDVIRTAYAYRGVRYRYGGSSRSGFDCSGFTSFVYQRNGISLPHNAAAQFSQGKRVSSGERKPGDLVFFSTTRRGISHVGIYVGDGKFVHASSGGGRVRVDSLNSGYYAKRYRGSRRVR